MKPHDWRFLFGILSVYFDDSVKWWFSNEASFFSGELVGGFCRFCARLSVIEVYATTYHLPFTELSLPILIIIHTLCVISDACFTYYSSIILFKIFFYVIYVIYAVKTMLSSSLYYKTLALIHLDLTPPCVAV